MSFDDDEPKDVCDQMPDPTVYKAKARLFKLGHSNKIDFEVI